jgi:hypothetical protein
MKEQLPGGVEKPANGQENQETKRKRRIDVQGREKEIEETMRTVEIEGKRVEIVESRDPDVEATYLTIAFPIEDLKRYENMGAVMDVGNKALGDMFYGYSGYTRPATMGGGPDLEDDKLYLVHVTLDRRTSAPLGDGTLVSVGTKMNSESVARGLIKAIERGK